MKCLDNIKVGAKKAPTFTILLYFIFVTLDVGTSFLASPDLKFEANYLIRYFNLNWIQIIIISTLFVFTISSGVIISFNFLHNSSHFNKKKKLITSIIIICIFYFHLYYSIFVSINNYFQYIWIKKIENPFSIFSKWYVNDFIKNNPRIYIFLSGIFIVIALCFTLYKIKKIQGQYKIVLNRSNPGLN